MSIKNLKELKINLVKVEKTAVWLAGQLGYSTTYMYDCVKTQKEKEIKRMEEILKKEV